MDAAGLTCTQDGNSTDCLLRVLIQLLGESRRADDANVDWDPLTFVFSLIIGVVALIFAVIPIIRVIIAPGINPGQRSRTTSRLAIGKYWSKRREKRWNWYEWTVQYTASTPIFHLETLENWINKDIAKFTGDADYEDQQLHGLNRIASNCIKRSDLERFAMNTTEETKHSEKDPDPSRDDVGSSLGTIIRAIIPWKASSARSARSKEMPAATWVGFFEKVGLDKIKPRDYWGTRRVIADYLPSDLVAAPAYAQIGVIVTAAATHGAATQIIDHKSDYPVIMGRTFKFEFRQHPILGAVGAYSDFLPDPNHKDPRTTLGDLGEPAGYTTRRKKARKVLCRRPAKKRCRRLPVYRDSVWPYFMHEAP
ncbi:hypothetical protein K456DRAFT_1761828 [Colletotrichum gloeosporioides 23]|nr:hypothetical protein K456DRAFT_1761828 [Colletotrichum gloeosporioides 23]